jgi:hypothetical protein
MGASKVQEVNTMSDPRVEQPDSQLMFLRDLLGAQATVAGDIVEIGLGTWAIHGSIPVDGDVIMAEYDTRDQARRALDALTAMSVTLLA